MENKVIDMIQATILDKVSEIKGKISKTLDQDESCDELEEIFYDIDQLEEMVENKFDNTDTQNFLKLMTKTINEKYFLLDEYLKIDGIVESTKFLLLYISLSNLLKDHYLSDYTEADLKIEEISADNTLISYFGHKENGGNNALIALMDFNRFLNDIATSNELLESGITKEIVIGFFQEISKNEKNFDFTKKYMLVDKNSGSKEACLAIIKLISLSRGACVHKPLASLATESVPVTPNPVLYGNFDYQQFDEIFIILSEMVYHKDVLTKFFSIYHIIENYVYRLPIIELDNAANGNMFSVRKFKNLYELTTKNESESIIKFIKKMWSRKVGGKEFHKHVKDNLLQLKKETLFNATHYDNFITNFNWVKKHDEITKDDSAMKKYAVLFYHIRNSIVHNKETEFHLSHFNLTPTAGAFIDKIIIEPMRDLIFELICDTSSEVWYKNHSLKLYKK